MIDLLCHLLEQPEPVISSGSAAWAEHRSELERLLSVGALKQSDPVRSIACPASEHAADPAESPPGLVDVIRSDQNERGLYPYAICRRVKLPRPRSGGWPGLFPDHSADKEPPTQPTSGPTLVYVNGVQWFPSGQ